MSAALRSMEQQCDLLRCVSLSPRAHEAMETLLSAMNAAGVEPHVRESLWRAAGGFASYFPMRRAAARRLPALLTELPRMAESLETSAAEIAHRDPSGLDRRALITAAAHLRLAYGELLTVNTSTNRNP